MARGDNVILLHGIFRSSRHLRKLAAHLAEQGYTVVNLDYPSTRQPLEELAEYAWREIAPQLPAEGEVHFVGYL